MTTQTPAERVRILGATLTNLADRMEGGEDTETSVAMLKFVQKKLKAIIVELQG